MSEPVKLYVYDLSGGLARQLSRELTGAQMDGIWHTSVVVFGKEVYYGQGIDVVVPGRSRYGQPLQIIDMGFTAIDQDTWLDYLDEMKTHYTADKYHLLDFNCNSFTNDCIGFLTGGSIPDFIKDLPSDFLASPLGVALRPTIDAMFGQSSLGPASAPAQPSPAPRAIRASYLPTPAPTSPARATTGTGPLTSPIHICTNPASMHSLLRTHRAVVAFFTSATCPPCRMIEPTFESLAQEKTAASSGYAAAAVAFAKIDLGVGMGGSVASEYGVRVTPTFMFFLDGKKMDEMKGANAAELRNQVNFLLHQAFPPHPHTSLALPAVEAISLNPILFTQVPVLDTVLAKLISFVDASPADLPKAQIKQTLSQAVLPYLKARSAGGKSPNASAPSADAVLLTTWSQVTAALVDALPQSELFPLVDLWRLAVLDPAVATWCVSHPAAGNGGNAVLDPISGFLVKALGSGGSSGAAAPRNYMLTLLRLLSNGISSAALAGRLLAPRRAPHAGSGSDADGKDAGDASRRSQTTDVLVQTLLHEDASVRTAAASLAFNVAACLQKARLEKARGGGGSGGLPGTEELDTDADWEVEMVSAVLEAISREEENVDVVHRLTASLALLVRLSPFYESQISPLP